MSVSRVTDPAQFIHTFCLPDAMDFRDQLYESIRKLIALLTIGDGEHLFYHGDCQIQWYLSAVLDVAKDAFEAYEGLEALIAKGEDTHV